MNFKVGDIVSYRTFEKMPMRETGAVSVILPDLVMLAPYKDSPNILRTVERDSFDKLRPIKIGYVKKGWFSTKWVYE